MKKKVIHVGSLFAVISASVMLGGAEAWSDLSNSITHWGALVGSVIVFVATMDLHKPAEPEPSLASPEPERPHPSDVALIDDYLKQFAEPWFLNFMKENDFCQTFRADSIVPLDVMLNEWNTANHEFIDEDIEQQRKGVFAKAGNLRTAIFTHCGVIGGNVDLLSVKTDNMDEARRQLAYEDGGKINDLVTEFLKAHEEMIRKGKAKLLCQNLLNE
ncbi:MAG: hypothetical protein ACJAYC_003566 [Halieaceae bacterium]|jgi:hypothetical protein